MRENRSISGVSNIWQVPGFAGATAERPGERAATRDDGAGAVADIRSLGTVLWTTRPGRNALLAQRKLLRRTLFVRSPRRSVSPRSVRARRSPTRAARLSLRC